MKSAVRLFAVLETLCVNGETGLTELSRQLAIGKSSTHRFLSVLRDLGYVDKNGENDKYFATLRVFELGALVRGRIRLVQLVRPYMEQLGNQFHETINLAFFEQGEVVYIDKVESVKTLRMDLAIGRQVPAHCTALGKVFLANLPQDQLTNYLRACKLQAHTDRTITEAEELKMHLDRVRRQGFAIDDGELDEGIRCIAAPIKGEFGKVLAAISIAGPSIRMTMERLKSLREPLMNVTTSISHQIGYFSSDDKTPFGPTDQSRLPKSKTSIPRSAK